MSESMNNTVNIMKFPMGPKYISVEGQRLKSAKYSLPKRFEKRPMSVVKDER